MQVRLSWSNDIQRRFAAKSAFNTLGLMLILLSALDRSAYSQSATTGFGAPTIYRPQANAIDQRSTTVEPITTQNRPSQPQPAFEDQTESQPDPWIAKRSLAPDVHRQREVVTASHTTANESSVTQAYATKPIPMKPKSSSGPDGDLSKPKSTWSSSLSMIISLMLVIAVFMIGAWLLRQATPSMAGNLPKEVVEIIGRTPLAPRQQMFVIRFGRKLVLVSHQAGETQTLSEIDDRTEVDHLLGLCEQASPRSMTGTFSQVLKQVVTGEAGKGKRISGTQRAPRGRTSLDQVG